MKCSKSDDDPRLSVEAVAAVFAHDIATPLSTARMNTDLLIEHISILKEGLSTEPAQDLPPHIQQALQTAPETIAKNISHIQAALREFKDYLNSLHEDNEYPEETAHKNLNQSLRILLVDDEEIHHDIGEAVLGSTHALSHVFSGEEAVEQIKTNSFDVILMDMQMKGMSGPQTTEAIRQHCGSNLLVIGLTNMPINAQKAQLLKTGFNAFLEKPLKQNTFNDALQKLTIKSA